jgi:predicted phage terminase large subunit-like protein
MNSVRITCCTVSELLARDLQHLLSRIGMSFHLRKKVIKLRTARQGDDYAAYYLSAADQDTTAKFMQTIGPRMRHEKRTRAAGIARCNFDSVLSPDPVVSVRSVGPGPCRCLSVDDDHSFTANDLAVHNSRIVSVCAPAWMWVRFPSWRVICLSKNPRVALRDALFSRRLIESQWYQQTFRPSWKLADDQNAKGNFGTTAGGSRQSAGFDAGVTGSRADALVVDDPIDIKDRHSAVERNAVIDAWDTAIRNRVNDAQRSTRIVIMQRVHPEDLIGHILEKERGAWAHFNLPQSYEAEQRCRMWTGWEDERSVEGELLFPERFPQKFLDEEANILGSADYAAIHQQRPRPRDGALIKAAWLAQRWSEPPTATRRLWAVLDPTAAERPTDWAVLQLWGESAGKRYLLDQVRGQWSPLGMETAAKDAIARWQARWGQIGAVLVERSAAGPAVAERLRAVIPGVITIVAKGSKEERVQSVAPQFESGSVMLPDAMMPGYAWVGALVDEMTAFPFGKHDDQVDCVAHALQHAHQQTAQIISLGDSYVARGKVESRWKMR